MQFNIGDEMIKLKRTCAVCETTLATPIILLPKLPLTEMFTAWKPKKMIGFFDQAFYFCERCQHGQLGCIIPPTILYKKSAYFFRTSESQTATQANESFLTFIKDAIKKKRFNSVIEFGASDLYLLNQLSAVADELVGIDPVLKADRDSPHIKVVTDFVEYTDLATLNIGNSLIISSHTLEHLENPKKIIAKFMQYATDQTLFIHQFPALDLLVADQRYDQIFHQHLHYFSFFSLIYLLKEVGAELISFKLNYHHWGTLMVAFRKITKTSKNHSKQNRITAISIRNGFRQFKNRLQLNNKYITSIQDKQLYGFGAALMLPVLSYHLGNDFSRFTAILDDDRKKTNHYYINLPVPIRDPQVVKDWQQATIVLTAVQTPRPVLKRILSFQPKRIILPLPII